MVVQLGKAQVFKGQMTELLDRVIGRESSRADLAE